MSSRLAALLLSTLIAAGTSSPPPAPSESGRTRIFDSHDGLAEGWQDIGWAIHSAAKGGPASLDFSGHSGWILAHPGLSGSFGWLVFRVRAPASYGGFLEVGVDSMTAERFPRVWLAPADGKPSDGGFLSYRIAISALDPKALPFDRIIFRAATDVGHDRVQLDDIALLEADEASAAAAPGRAVHVTIDCAKPGRAISPLIYGVAGDAQITHALGATARRWGGNPTSRYNWAHPAWNVASDWFFRNTEAPPYERWLEENRKADTKAALTLPMLGWVAKDTTSYSFPVSVFGPQAATAPENGDMGNGVGRDGKPIAPGPPSRTSVPAPPEFIRKWVAAIRAHDGAKGRSVQQYILDNEPTIWNVTHRDVHPDPVSYDELFDRTVKYATAVREADPQATISGLVAWGWSGYFYSGVDLAPGSVPHLDRISHGNTPLLPWWLQKVRGYENQTGKRLIDILDVHFYPQAQGVGLAGQGDTSPQGAALRIRSTRALWDPTYVDESWINEPIMLLPRLHRWVDDNAPGMGISIGEYNFGAEQHMSGGLALAEALGRFGEGGLTSAFYWTAPPEGSPAFWAFRAYRNFDGQGGRFLDSSVPVKIDGTLASAFASRDAATGHLVVVLLNFDPALAADSEIEISSCGLAKSRRMFTYAGRREGFVAVPEAAPDHAGLLRERLAPYSMTVLDLGMDRP